MPRIARPGHVPALVTTLILALSSGVAAHEIPADISVRLFVKPEGQRLRLLARASLAAMRDVEFPKLGPGYLDLARADASLRNGAMLWIADSVRPYEDGERLEAPRNVAVRVSLPADRSFGRYEQALAHVADAPLPGDTEIYWNQARLDVRLEYPIHSDRSEFSIDPAFASRRCGWLPLLGSCRPTAGLARSSLPAIPAWSGWIRAGTGPPSGSWTWGPCTSSAESSIGGFSCAS